MKETKANLYWTIKYLSERIKGRDKDGIVHFHITVSEVHQIKEAAEKYIALGGKRDISKFIEI